jgi:uncharacterized protein involved in response to NO
MSQLFATGGIVDLILGLVAAEALLLAALRRWTGRGPALGALLGNLLAGACLLLALRAALTGTPWQWTAAWLAAALAAHLWDLGQRWPRRPAPGNPGATSVPGGVQ